MIGEYDKLTSLTAERDDAIKEFSKALTLNMTSIWPICNGTHAVSNYYNSLCGHANASEECYVERPRHMDLCGYHADTSELQHCYNWAQAAGYVQEHTHRES